MGLISLVSISLGIFFNTLILISLPVLNGSDFFGVSLYATSISFADPFNGTLNAEYSFFNLTTLLVSLAAFLQNYNRLFSVQLGNW